MVGVCSSVSFTECQVFVCVLMYVTLKEMYLSVFTCELHCVKYSLEVVCVSYTVCHWLVFVLVCL